VIVVYCPNPECGQHLIAKGPVTDDLLDADAPMVCGECNQALSDPVDQQVDPGADVQL
jgi:hypothetical protein